MLSLAVIACLEVDKISLNPEFFQSTNTAHWISVINHLLEWQSITSEVYPHCQNWGEFPIRKCLWSKAWSQQEREGVSLRGEEGVTLLSRSSLCQHSHLGEEHSQQYSRCCQAVHPLPAILPTGPIIFWGGAGTQIGTFYKTKHRIPSICCHFHPLLPQFNTQRQTHKCLERIFLRFGMELKIQECLPLDKTLPCTTEPDRRPFCQDPAFLHV